jgi:hypothetical protein
MRSDVLWVLHVLLLSLALSVFLGNTPVLLAQSNFATLSGTVTDQSGAMAANVKIWVTNNATNVRREAVSNKEGSFVFAGLEPGTYNLRVESPGFAAVEKANIILNTGDRRQIDITLKVGTTSETVTVSAESVGVEISPAVSTLVDRQFVSNIPLNGRTFQNLISLTPGVVPVAASSFTPGQFSVNGQRTSANYYTVDGVSANFGAGVQEGEQGFGGSGLSGGQASLTANGTTASLLSVDELDEFRIQTSNYAPEYGRTPGAQVQLTTRSGTKDFHGSASEYFRNDVLDARDWFVNYLRLPKPAERQNDFGTIFGGPLWLPWAPDEKERTFFFLSYEGTRLRQPQTIQVDVPSLAIRHDPTTSQYVLPYLNAFPIPNRNPGATTPDGWQPFVASFSNASSVDSGAIRIDHRFSDSLNAFARYSYSPSSYAYRSESTISSLTHVESNVQTLTVGLTLLLSPTLVDEVRFNYSRDGYSNYANLDSFGGAVPLTRELFSPLSSLSPDNAYAQYQFGYNNDFNMLAAGVSTINSQKQLNLVNSITKSIGTHQFKAGIDYRRLFPTTTQGAGYFVSGFNTTAEIQEGEADFVDATLQQSKFRPVYSNTSLFVQGTWKVNRWATLTYGVRWDYNPAPKDASGLIPIFLKGTDISNLVAAPRGTPLYDVGTGAFAPRLGGSFEVIQTPHWETVLRTGFGVFYDLGNSVAATALNPSSYPFSTSYTTATGVHTPLPFSAADIQVPPYPTATAPPFPADQWFAAFAPNYELPRTLQWNVAIEQAIGEKHNFSVTYVGNAGRRLLNQRQFYLDASYTDFPDAIVTADASEATSDYDALELQFNRKLSNGLQVLASYSWAHAIDEISDEFSLALLRGPSDFDIRHTVTGALSYDLPYPIVPHARALLGGWSVEGIFAARSQRPVSVVDNTQNLLPNGKYLLTYADVVSGEPLYLYGSKYPGGKAFNPAAFVAPPTGEQGDLPRNAMRGFGMYQLDFSLHREFRLYECLHLESKVDVFNIFNHPNFGDPDSYLGESNFGLSYSTLATQMSGDGAGLNALYSQGGPRSLQVSLKLNF